MGRHRKQTLAEKVAFESIYAKSRTSRIPQEIQDELLDAYTKFCDRNDTEDILIKYIPNLFKTELKVPGKLLTFINVQDFGMDGLETSSSDVSQIVDFEKYLYEGALLLRLNAQIDIIDYYWYMTLAIVNGKSELSSAEKKTAYKQRIYLNDLKMLCQKLKQDVPTSVMLDMITVINDGERAWMNYMDFALVLGRTGILGEW